MRDSEKIDALAKAVSMMARYLDEVTNTRFEQWIWPAPCKVVLPEVWL